MFREIKPHKKFKTSYGDEREPVATLQEKTGGLCHIIIEEGCYVCYLETGDLGFIPIVHIFPELHEALSTLDSPLQPE